MAPPPGNGPGAGGPGGFGRGRPSPDGRHDDLDPRELQKLDITIPDDAAEKIQTIGEAVKHIESQAAKS